MEERSGLKGFVIAVCVLFIAVIVVNALAVVLPLNGMSTGELSDAIPNLFVPAGFTFSIWGVIYLLMAGFVGAAFVTAFSKEGKRGLGVLDGLLGAANMVLNAAWIVAWHWQQIFLSLLVMLGLLVTLVVMQHRLASAFKGMEPAAGFGEKLRRFLIRQPINVYLGWICVATIANVTALLVTVGWDGFGLSPVIWTVAVIVVGTAIGGALVLMKGAVASALVFVWAFYGIMIKRLATDPDQTMPIIVAAGACGVVLLGLCTWKLLKKPA